MPRKSTKNTSNVEESVQTPATTTSVAPVAVASVAPATTPVKASKAKVVEVVSDVVTEEQPCDAKKNVQRHVPTSESIEKEFDQLIASLDEEIKKLRESTAKSKGVKFLRTINKQLKTIKNHALRVSKKKTSTRRNNTNSGFLKPVQISKDLAKFTGWDQNELRSRVDVTKYICNYIKEKNLQDPSDKRNIRVEEDNNLKKLLKFDGNDKKPLTYYRLQTYLKSHFTPAPVEA
jgi:chromatin remodeling complex protein RSC6